MRSVGNRQSPNVQGESLIDSLAFDLLHTLTIVNRGTAQEVSDILEERICSRAQSERTRPPECSGSTLTTAPWAFKEAPMTAGEFCTRQVITIHGDDTLVEAAQSIRKHHVGTLIVVEE